MSPVSKCQVRQCFQYIFKRLLFIGSLCSVFMTLLFSVPAAVPGEEQVNDQKLTGRELLADYSRNVTGESGSQSTIGENSGTADGSQSMPGENAGTADNSQGIPGENGANTDNGQGIPGENAGNADDGQGVPGGNNDQNGSDGSQNEPGQNGGTGDGSQNVPGEDDGPNGSDNGQGVPGENDDTIPGTDKEENKPGGETNQQKLEISITLKSDNTARIKWQGVKADSFEVQRANKKDGKYKTIASFGRNGRKYIDGDVKSGSWYYYRVKAVLENNQKIYSKIEGFACPINKVTNIKLTRYSSSSVKVSWKADSQAKYYKIYCSKTKGSYKYAGITKKNWFRVKKLETGQKYYFYVQACVKKTESRLNSVMSKAAAVQTVPYERTTIFAGDSITVGLESYRAIDAMAIGGVKHVVADIGLNTTTFRTRRVFNGKSGLDQVIASRPYRVYLMLGMNEIHYRSSADVAAGYEEIVRAVKAGTPNTDIVLLAVSPVTKAERQRRSGFAQIPDLNNRIKAMAENLKVRYYDYTAFLKDSDGCLKTSLASSDGVHWTSAAYHTFADVMKSYDLSLD